MKLSVIVPCRNAAKTIAAQLDALTRQQWADEWEVIVADNGSTDSSPAIVKQYEGRLPGLCLVDASTRPGAGHARNAGARRAKGTAIVFCDADDEVGEGWLTAMGQALCRYDFVASRMDVDKLNPASLAMRLNNVQGKELRKTSFPPYLAHAGSSGMGIKKSIHDAVGGFDESLPQREDTDYCFRVQLTGTPLHFIPGALIHIRYNNQPQVLFRQARQWAVYQELMFKRYGTGMGNAHPWKSYVQKWRGLIYSLPCAFSKESRSAWMKALGTQVGLLQGALRYGVPPLYDSASSVEHRASLLAGRSVMPRETGCDIVSQPEAHEAQMRASPHDL